VRRNSSLTRQAWTWTIDAARDLDETDDLKLDPKTSAQRLKARYGDAICSCSRRLRTVRHEEDRQGYVVGNLHEAGGEVVNLP